MSPNSCAQLRCFINHSEESTTLSQSPYQKTPNHVNTCVCCDFQTLLVKKTYKQYNENHNDTHGAPLCMRREDMNARIINENEKKSARSLYTFIIIIFSDQSRPSIRREWLLSVVLFNDIYRVLVSFDLCTCVCSVIYIEKILILNCF